MRKSKVIEQWEKEQLKENGAYAVYTGFEAAIRNRGSDTMVEAYEEMSIYDRINLFGVVTDLLEEEATAWAKAKVAR